MTFNRTAIVLAVATVLASPLLVAPSLLGASSASAATSKQKMDTCNFGADDQKLTGAKRKAFMTKCMSAKNDPRGKATGTPAAKPPQKEEDE